MRCKPGWHDPVFWAVLDASAEHKVDALDAARVHVLFLHVHDFRLRLYALLPATETVVNKSRLCQTVKQFQKTFYMQNVSRNRKLQYNSYTNPLPMELFSIRRWRLYQSKWKAVVFMTKREKICKTCMAIFHSCLTFGLIRCSSPSP